VVIVVSSLGVLRLEVAAGVVVPRPANPADRPSAPRPSPPSSASRRQRARDSAATGGSGTRTRSLLTQQQVAGRFGTSFRFVRRLVEERRIPYTKLGKHVRIEEADAEAFIAAGHMDAIHVDGS
jgi:excisionase family DNA binding protein